MARQNPNFTTIRVNYKQINLVHILGCSSLLLNNRKFAEETIYFKKLALQNFLKETERERRHLAFLQENFKEVFKFIEKGSKYLFSC